MSWITEAGLINQWAQQEIQKLSGRRGATTTQSRQQTVQEDAEAETRRNGDPASGSLTLQHLQVGPMFGCRRGLWYLGSTSLVTNLLRRSRLVKFCNYKS